MSEQPPGEAPPLDPADDGPPVAGPQLDPAGAGDDQLENLPAHVDNQIPTGPPAGGA